VETNINKTVIPETSVICDQLRRLIDWESDSWRRTDITILLLEC